MAGVWEGFTEEDIEILKKSNEDVPKKKAANLQGVAKKNVARERILAESRKQTPLTEMEIPENAKLSKKSKEIEPLIEKKIEEKKVIETGLEKQEEEIEKGPTITASNPVCIKVIEGKAYELVNKNSVDVSKATLEVFEARQRMLEEQNKKRKEMLAKVISARKKQTTEEAKRLQHIQEELQKLDVLLSNDVGILRNKIEEASLDFAEAQKRYNKAEKEFVDAKQNLFSKLEKKELLTKLLCTIIEQNELRKAQKLSELMEKLRINENPDGISVILQAENQSALTEKKSAESEKEKQAA